MSRHASSPLPPHIQSLQTQTREMEGRLARALSSNNSKVEEKNVNRYRMLLCEWYADWILSHPSSAAIHAVGPLWRSCFYGRIGPARARLQKEQRALEKKAHEEEEKLKQSIQQQTESLQVFLSEGITLYEYLCDKLQYELTNAAHTTSQEEEASHPPTSSSGIVPCLYRLYISLGDLYRYWGKASDAAPAYAMAARLGPGHGHAYNQLAVLEQMQPAATAVTVYWYVRALAAAAEPFGTALANLRRLQEGNRAAILGTQDDHTATTSQKYATRHCLALFVDVHYALQQQQPNDDTADDMATKMTLCVDAFGRLLQQSAWSDALLAKLVAILAYSESSAAAKEEHRVAARVLTLEMGARLGQRLAEPGPWTASLRVWWPWLLLTEYLLAAQVTQVDAGVWQERHDAAQVAFWNALVAIFNRSRDECRVDDTVGAMEDEPGLAEYREFRGFAPFASFGSSHDDDHGFLSDRAAAPLLVQRSQSETTQSTAPSSSALSLSLSNRAASTRSQKVRCLWQLRDALCAAGHARPRPDGGLWEAYGTNQTMDDDDDRNDEIPMDVENNAIPLDDEGGDVISSVRPLDPPPLAPPPGFGSTTAAPVVPSEGSSSLWWSNATTTTTNPFAWNYAADVWPAEGRTGWTPWGESTTTTQNPFASSSS